MAIRSSWYRRKSVSAFLQLIEMPKSLFMKMSYYFVSLQYQGRLDSTTPTRVSLDEMCPFEGRD
jgi:hypothetical protein